MGRKTALSAVGMILRGVIIGSELILTGFGQSSNKVLPGESLSEDQVQWLDAIGNVNIPETSEGSGAGQLKVGAFANDHVAGFCKPDEQRFFQDSIDDFRRQRPASL